MPRSGRSSRAPAAHLPASEPGTRARVIAAAIDTILDEGFYRASSNRIAHRAGVSWGVIQYHFGTREGLLVEVFKASMQDLLDTLRAAEITGESFEERVESFADVMWAFYRQPKFVAYEQVTLNLTHDPNTAGETLATMATMNAEIAKRLNELMDRVVDRDRRAVLPRTALLHLFRGLALSLSLYEAVPGPAPRRRSKSDDDPERTVLIAALTALVGSTRGRPGRPA